MNKRTFTFACLLLAAPLAAAELTPVGQRRTDEAHRADQATFKGLADRIAALSSDAPARAPAAAWLLVAQTEYDRTDRTAFVAESLARAERALAPDAPDEPALAVHRSWIAHRRTTAGFRAALPLLAAAESLETPDAPDRAQPAQPDARPAHITDRLHALQSRLAALWDAGLPAESYAFAQAQHWLDFATDEHHARDRSGIVATAAGEAEKIIAPLEADARSPRLAVAMPAPDRRVRPDLWARADAARPADLASRLTARDPRLAALARLEVQLRWAAHEDAQRGWRAARSFVQLAERYARAVAAPSAP
jgi:hypothetical protein